jgi:hypothetical protein
MRLNDTGSKLYIIKSQLLYIKSQLLSGIKDQK